MRYPAFRDMGLCVGAGVLDGPGRWAEDRAHRPDGTSPNQTGVALPPVLSFEPGGVRSRRSPWDGVLNRVGQLPILCDRLNGLAVRQTGR